nr:MAG TPA: hypothetical protein [Caudoviricetes sp.]
MYQFLSFTVLILYHKFKNLSSKLFMNKFYF